MSMDSPEILKKISGSPHNVGQKSLSCIVLDYSVLTSNRDKPDRVLNPVPFVDISSSF